jgi:hypothetical protein
MRATQLGAWRDLEEQDIDLIVETEQCHLGGPHLRAMT